MGLDRGAQRKLIVDLDQLRSLPPRDQRIFLLGRIAAETTSMDAALRFLHAALDGQEDFGAYLDAPDRFSDNIKACRKLLDGDAEMDGETKNAVHAAIDSSADAYNQRNRYAHDLLRKSLVDRSWELARLSRQPDGRPEFAPVSFDTMVALVLVLVAATWRLRACGLYLTNGTWAGMALGTVEGEWDGSANYVR